MVFKTRTLLTWWIKEVILIINMRCEFGYSGFITFLFNMRRKNV